MGTQDITNWLTLALVIVTMIYSLFTYMMVRQMKAQYTSFLAPIISISVKIKYSQFFCLKVANVGRSTAKNVRMIIDKDFYRFGEYVEGNNLRGFPAFNRAMPSLAPSEELFFMLSQGFNLTNQVDGQDITPKQFSIRVEYDFDGKRHFESHEIDLEFYFSTSSDEDEEIEKLDSIGKELEKIRKALGKN